jgi:hypothetical protein
VGKPICQRCRSLADLRAAARAFLSTVKVGPASCAPGRIRLPGGVRCPAIVGEYRKRRTDSPDHARESSKHGRSSWPG